MTGEGALQSFTVALQQPRSFGEDLVELGAGAARAEVFVSEDVAELPQIGTELADRGVVVGGRLSQFGEAGDDRLDVFLAAGAVVGTDAQRLRQLIEGRFDARAVGGGDLGADIDQVPQRPLPIAVAVQGALKLVHHRQGSVEFDRGAGAREAQNVAVFQLRSPW